MILKGKPVVTLPGCPSNPYNFLGVVLQFATLGTLPKLDELGRPTFAYGRTIHEHCPRRAHFDAGRFAEQVRRRGAPPGVLPLQARLQGADDARQLLDAGVRRGRRLLADRHRPPVRRLHRAGRRVPHPDARRRCRSTGRRRRTPTRRSTRTRDGSVPSPPPSRASSAARSSAPECVALATHRRRSTPPTPKRWRRRFPGGLDVGISRRNAFKARHRRGRGHGRDAAAAPSAPMVAPADAVGLLYDTTKCIGCKACMVACREANGLEADTALVRRPLPGAARSQRARPRRSSSCSTTATQRSFMKAQCMHCIDPACASACMLGAFKKREFGIVTYDVDLLRRLPLLRGGVPVRRAEVRVVEGAAEDGQVRAVQSPAREGAAAGVLGGLPAPGGHLREARGSAARGPAAHRGESRQATSRRSTARPTAAARSASISRTCRSRRSACRRSARNRPPRCSAPSSTASTRASWRRWHSTGCSDS